MSHRTPIFYGWVIVVISGLAWLLAGGIFYTFGVFFKPVATSFGWGRATTSLAFALNAVSAGLSAPLIGILADRYGPRRLVFWGGLFVAICYILLSLAQTRGQFYLLFILIGPALTTVWVAVPAMVNRWFVARRGLAQGLMGAGGGVGALTFPPLASFLILNIGWRGAYLWLGLGVGLLLAVLTLFMKQDPGEMGLAPYGESPVGKAVPLAQRGYSLGQALVSSSYWKVFVIASFFILSYLMVMVHLVPYATDKGVSPIAAAGLISALGASSIVGRVVWGAIADRIGRGIALGLSLLLGGALFSLLLTAGNWGLMLVFASLFGFAYGGWVANIIALQADLFGLAAIGAILGVTEMAMDVGGAVGGYLAGYIFDATGSYSWAFVLGAAVLLLSSALAFSLSPPQKRP